MSRPKKGEVEPLPESKSSFGIGMLFGRKIKIDPEKFHELVADKLMRETIAGSIETVLSDQDFTKRFGPTVGGQQAEFLRIAAWLDWHPSPPSYLLIDAWESGLEKRAMLLSKWMLIDGTQKQREELRSCFDKLPYPIRELDIRRHFERGEASEWRKLETLTDTAIVLALKVFDIEPPPLEKGHYPLTPAAQMGDFLMKASFTKGCAPKTKEDSAREALKNLGFSKDSGNSGVVSG